MKFLDSSIIIGAAIKNDQWHPAGRRLLNEICEGKHGKILISEYILLESITAIGYQLGGKKAREVYLALTNSKQIDVMGVGKQLLDRAMSIHLRYDGKLSVTDSISVQIMQDKGINEILSFDSDFDKVKGIRRID